MNTRIIGILLTAVGTLLICAGIVLIPSLANQKAELAQVECQEEQSVRPAPAPSKPTPPSRPPSEALPTETSADPAQPAPVKASSPASPSETAAQEPGRWIILLDPKTNEPDEAGQKVLIRVVEELKADPSSAIVLIGINQTRKSTRRALQAATRTLSRIQKEIPLPENRYRTDFRQTDDATGMAVEIQLTDRGAL